MSSEQDKSSEDDRREYFRIDDAVRLSIRKIPAEEVEERLARLEEDLSGNFTLMSSLAAISAEMAVSLRRIEHREPDVATYLKALDRKIEVLGRAFLTQESDLLSGPARTVNLSAGGASLLVNELYDEEQIVELKMLLFPSFTGVLTFGTVVDCVPFEASEEPSDYKYRMRIEFTHMREQDRDVLIRHVLRCQSSKLRRREGTTGD